MNKQVFSVIITIQLWQLQDTVVQNNNRRVSSCSPEHKKHHSMRRDNSL